MGFGFMSRYGTTVLSAGRDIYTPLLYSRYIIVLCKILLPGHGALAVIATLTHFANWPRYCGGNTTIYQKKSSWWDFFLRFCKHVLSRFWLSFFLWFMTRFQMKKKWVDYVIFTFYYKNLFSKLLRLKKIFFFYFLIIIIIFKFFLILKNVN